MLHFTLEPAACRVIGLWALLPGAVAAPFLFWQGFAPGAFFAAVWLILSLVLIPARAASLRGMLSRGELQVTTGILFKVHRRLPARFVTGFTRIGTPLLRSCGCCLLILYSSGVVIFLPGLSNGTADGLLAALEEARP